MTYTQRARTKAQKKQFLKRMEKLWEANPSLRFSQLLENVFHHTSDNHCFYFVEDDELLSTLERWYKDSKIVN